jgi:hypothetical protein
VLRSEFEAEEEEIRKKMAEVETQEQTAATRKSRMAHARRADEEADR